MPPTTKKLQLEIAKHFESAHEIKNVRFVLERNKDDFWEGYRDESSFLLPPRVYEMTVLPVGLDTRRLKSTDTRKLNAVADAYGFIYAPGHHVRCDRVYFVEKQSPAESLGQEIAATWLSEKPVRTLPRIAVTPAEFIEAGKIFMRFIEWHNGKLEPEEIEKAVDITKRLVKRCDPALTRADDEFKKLVTYVTVTLSLVSI